MKKNNTLSQDIFASIVVFLIAMPLCLGIAIACGVDPIKGVFTGIIGGVVVGVLSGSPLQIAGPSAGLTVMVLHIVSIYGVKALIPLGVAVGIIQILIGVFRIAHFFQATPPALLKALLSGIGALIVLGQNYILFELPMSSDPIKNLAGIPDILMKVVSFDMTDRQIYSLVIAMIVIVILIGWKFGKHKFFEIIPGPLVATVAAAIIVVFTGWDMKMITVPENIFAEAFSGEYLSAFAVTDFSFYLYACGVAFISTIETLLCVSAVDKMAQTTSSYNKQIKALGMGNIACGAVGAIPIVGVIVRSAANIEFGAKTRLSSIMHGVWMAVILLFPSVLELIPIPALAGLLIYTGIKLLDIPHMFDYIRNYNKTSLIFFSTFILTMTVDLLVGVLAGFIVAILILVFDVLKFDLEITNDGDNKHLKFNGKLSFLDLPVLSKKLQGQNIDGISNVEICLQEVEYLDPAISEYLEEFKDKLESKGKNIEIHYSKLNIH